MGRHKGTPSKKFKRINTSIGLAMGVIALSVGSMATYASFTDSGSSTISATAGKITLAMGATGTAKTANITLGSTLVPGGVIGDKTIVIRNTGTIPMKYTAAITGTPGTLAGTMTATIKNEATSLYTGKMNAMKISTQTIDAGGTHTLTLGFAWANDTAAVDNALMGTNANTSLTFTATN